MNPYARLAACFVVLCIVTGLLNAFWNWSGVFTKSWERSQVISMVVNMPFAWWMARPLREDGVNE